MKRHHFLLLAGFLACFFSLSMILAPDQMLANVSTISNEGARNVLRWLGANLLAIGVINLLAARDPGSPALRAIMIGNIVVHAVAFTLDAMDHLAAVVKGSGLAMGAVVHILLIIGFVIYLRGLPPAKVVPTAA